MAQDKAAAILEALEVAGAAHGVDVVDVEVVGATKAPTVRVRLDWSDEGKGTISLDDVAAQTEWVSDVIDVVDPFPGSFTLEVSSPGLDRPLRRERDFERFAGEQVALTTTAMEGRKRFSGKLVGMREGQVVLDTDEGEVSIALDEVRRCTIKPTFAKGEKKTFSKQPKDSAKSKKAGHEGE
ncbi:ribosome maturation factor RimP [Parolsenella catena]|uniref:ribosome maturation factor RimP n=1 Tax=Parolsenella catena TaxID=2003188 RepID=UPI002FDE5282